MSIDFLYQPKPDDPLYELLGELYKPPATFKPWIFYRVAHLKENSEHAVNIYEMRCPANFYKIKVLPYKTRGGKIVEGFVLETGSGAECARLAVTIAMAIRDGMLALREKRRSKCQSLKK